MTSSNEGTGDECCVTSRHEGTGDEGCVTGRNEGTGDEYCVTGRNEGTGDEYCVTGRNEGTAEECCLDLLCFIGAKRVRVENQQFHVYLGHTYEHIWDSVYLGSIADCRKQSARLCRHPGFCSFITSLAFPRL